MTISWIKEIFHDTLKSICTKILNGRCVSAVAMQWLFHNLYIEMLQPEMPDCQKLCEV